MLKTFTAAAAAVAASLVVVSAASAATFSGTFDLSGISFSEPGLVVSADPMSGEVSFDLEEGESDSFALFNIWTDETHVNSDDRSQNSIAASFTLTDPVGAGVLDGLTVGRSFIGLYQWGTLVWGEPIDIAFGDGGLLRLGLSDAVFNTGLFGLKEGQRYGDTVYATATYVAAPAVSAVPLPASALLLAGGLAAIGTLRRRKAVA